MFGLIIPSWLKNALTCAVVAIAAYGAGYVHGGIASHSQAKSEALQATLEQIEERNQTDEQVNALDLPDLCRELGGQWMPDNTCQ